MLSLSWFAGSDAPYVPTKNPNLKKALIKAGVKKDKSFWELGSGDGRVVLEAAKLGAISFGIEQSWLRIFYSIYQTRRLHLNSTFIHGNVFKKNYHQADVIFIYLLTPAVLRLEKKLKSELKKGSKVITQTYHFKNWQPTSKLDNFWIYTS